ncbi:hypothetical protein FQR65_LT19930 [Abscondita terminalis]|nr:hypothetical protein FQR65_LT19930 [Abscondita terminalis]
MRASETGMFILDKLQSTKDQIVGEEGTGVLMQATKGSGWRRISIACIISGHSAWDRLLLAGWISKHLKKSEADTLNPDITNTDISLGAVIAELNKPSVCIIEGDVYAGGFLIFLECTYVFAKQSVRFALPEVRIGIFPFQVLASLLKHLPDAKAMDLCIRGTSFTASQAHELGLVTDFVENEDDHKIKMLIADLIMGAPLAIRKGFEALKQIKELAATDRYAYLLKVLHELKDSEDAKEGLAAQRDKRPPEWKNR